MALSRVREPVGVCVALVCLAGCTDDLVTSQESLDDSLPVPARSTSPPDAGILNATVIGAVTITWGVTGDVTTSPLGSTIDVGTDGAITIENDGTLSITPPSDIVDPATTEFAYEFTNGAGEQITRTGTVTTTVGDALAVPPTPILGRLSYVLAPGNHRTLFAPGAMMSIGPNGVLEIGPDGRPNLTPPDDFHSGGSFQYTLSDVDGDFILGDVVVRTGCTPVQGGDPASGLCAFDFGDAPSPFPTLLASDGARHAVGSALFLGTAPDDEPDGQPDGEADADDEQGSSPDDEDGVTFSSGLGLGANASVDVMASTDGILNAWIDFNGNGVWESGTPEQIAVDVALGAGSNTVPFGVPGAASLGDRYARFRVSTMGGLAPTGQALDGEVEDYVVSVVVPPPQKAFPSAEGFGAHAVGGRGGTVIEVTNLNDDGPGSLRAALLATGPRIVVFRVGGTIELESNVRLFEQHSYLTIAGQTAPGDGIQTKGGGLQLRNGTHDVIIRHFRSRPGYDPALESVDPIVIVSVLPDKPVRDIILDHCSMYWGPDEGINVWNYAEDITIQWCISEGLEFDVPDERFEHSRALKIGTKPGWGHAMKGVTLHHSYLANSATRNPLVGGDGPSHIINNLVYNWRDYAGDMFNNTDNGVGVRVNWIGNYFKKGPESTNDRYEINLNTAVPVGMHQWTEDDVFSHVDDHVYVHDNIGPHRPTSAQDDWDIVGLDFDDAAPEEYRRTTPWPDSPVPVTVHAAQDLPDIVLANVGATVPIRDALDQKAVNDYYNGTGFIREAVNLTASDWPTLMSGTPPTDTDHDGMPDAWETAHGLDPNDPADGAHYAANGYTNVENYLNELAGDTIPTLPDP